MRQSRRLFSRLLPVPLAVASAERAGSISATLEKKGVPLDFRDAMIAGNALEYRPTLVTRNSSG